MPRDPSFGPVRPNLSSLTAARVLALVAMASAAPLLAPEAVAQRAPTIQATATVVGPVQSITFRADTVRSTPRRETERLLIAGLGMVDVSSGPGGVTRVTTVDADRPTRVVRITIDYVGS